ncbi:hypothetical protein Tco_0188697 [Tanacetum coccineum]
MDPVMQCTTLPSHSSFSQKILVSLVTEINKLSVDIEQSDNLLYFTVTNGDPSSVSIKQHCVWQSALRRSGKRVQYLYCKMVVTELEDKSMVLLPHSSFDNTACSYSSIDKDKYMMKAQVLVIIIFSNSVHQEKDHYSQTKNRFLGRLLSLMKQGRL